MRYIIVSFAIEREGDYYVAKCIELETSSFGCTKEEAIKNLSDATALYLNTLEDLGERQQVLEQKGIPVYQDEPGSREITYPASKDRSVGSAVFPLQAAAV